MFNSTNTTTPFSTDDCTLSTCPISDAQLTYDPSLTANTFFLALFGVCLAITVPSCIYHRTWGYLVAMTMGLTLEMIGYIGRIQMHYNPFIEKPFMMYGTSFVCLHASGFPRHLANGKGWLKDLIAGLWG